MLKKLLISFQKSACNHTFAYIKADIIGGRRVAKHICTKCRKFKFVEYEHEYERDRLFTDMIFFSAGRQKQR